MKRLLMQLSFWQLAIASAVGYFIIALWFPLLPHFDQYPVRDIFAFSRHPLLGVAYGLWLTTMAWLYWRGYQTVVDRPVSPKAIALSSALFTLPLLFTFPINATDIYRYYLRGLVDGVYGLNPYLVAPNAVVPEALHPFAGEWLEYTSPYGPLWELVAGRVSFLVGDNLLAALLSFKLLAILLFLATGGLIWQTLAELPPAQRRGRYLLWAWSPPLLLTFGVNAHNDALMLFWFVLSWWALGQNRPVVAWLLALLAALSKPIGLLALPFVGLAAWHHAAPEAQPFDFKPRLKFLLAIIVGSVLVVVAAFLPFGSPASLISRLIAESQGGASFSPATVLILVSRALKLANSFERVGQIATILLGIWALWLIVRVIFKRLVPQRGAANLFIGYLLQAFNFRLWYTTWLFPWLLLDVSKDVATRRRLLAGIAFLFSAQYSVLLYSHVRVFLFSRDIVAAHYLGVPFTFLLPLLVYYLSGRYGLSFDSGGREDAATEL